MARRLPGNFLHFEIQPVLPVNSMAVGKIMICSWSLGFFADGDSALSKAGQKNAGAKPAPALME